MIGIVGSKDRLEMVSKALKEQSLRKEENNNISYRPWSKCSAEAQEVVNMPPMWLSESPVGLLFFISELWTAHIGNHQTRVMYHSHELCTVLVWLI